MREITVIQAISEALNEEMRRDDRVLVFGQGARGRLYGTTRGLFEAYGPDRVFDMPIVENTEGGIALGSALAGYRPVLETTGGFLSAGFEETVHLAASWRMNHGGYVSLPLVVIAQAGGRHGGGGEHTAYPSGVLLNFPGLKIAVPSSPYDVKGLLKTAIRDDNPVIFMYHSALAARKGEVPDEDYTVPFGVAEIRRAGDDVTVIASSLPVVLALDAAEQIAPDISVEVVDLRTLEPLDVPTIMSSVRKTGRVVLVDEGPARAGVVAELSALIMEQAFDSLRAPVERLGRQAGIAQPWGVAAEAALFPSTASIAEAIQRVVQHESKASVSA